MRPEFRDQYARVRAYWCRNWLPKSHHAPAIVYARPSHRICVVSQLLCVGQPLLSQVMCAGNGHLLRVGPFIIARRYSYMLISGMHRLEAVKELGWAEVPVTVLDLIGPAAVIAECDENLCGTNLSKAERALFMKHRKVAYEALHPEAKHGGDRRQFGDLKADRFTADTAAKTGRSERDVQRDTERGENIPKDVLKDIAGTSLDKGVVLDALAKAPDPQAALDAIKRERDHAEAHKHNAQAGEALRNAKAKQQAAPAVVPLRLPSFYGSDELDEDATDLESAAWELLDRHVCPDSSKGYSLNTEFADVLVTLIERDPQDLVAYIRKFVAIKAAAFQPKPTKRKVERKTDEIPF